MGTWLSSVSMPKKRLEDLSNDCLMEVLDQLSPADLMKMARVNKRLNGLVEVKLGVKIQKVVVEREDEENPIIQSLNCRHRRFDPNEVVSFDSMFAEMQMNEVQPNRRDIRKDFHNEPAKAVFLKTLARFTSLKSINFGKQELTCEVLQEMARLCPEIECLTVKRSVVDESVWNDFFTQVGHQIVHFQWLSPSDERTILYLQQHYSLSSERILEMIVLMCPNIKHIVYFLLTLTVDQIALLKQLPQDCSVGVIAVSVNQPLDEAIDFLLCNTLNWSCFKNSSNYRLTELVIISIISLDEPDSAVEFADLKKLSWDPVKKYSKPDIDYLCACRFPLLESFDFSPNSDLSEHDYEVLFENMPEVKELIIRYLVIQFHPDYQPYEGALPGDAVFQLKRLERIRVTVSNGALNWQSESFVQRLNWYVEEIPSLKSLVVTLYGKQFPAAIRDQMQMIAEELEQLKERQKRVEIVVTFL